jgi:hypothetical protein
MMLVQKTCNAIESLENVLATAILHPEHAIVVPLAFITIQTVGRVSVKLPDRKA